MIIENIRFIKLGSQKANKEDECLENGKMVLGYHGIRHFENYQELDHDLLKMEFIENHNSDAGAASRHAKQIMSFYDQSETTLWITFAEKKMWWGFVDQTKEPYQDKDNFTFRDMKDGWKDVDEKGSLLTFENISGALLKTQGFRGTICDIKNKSLFGIEEYTKRLILGQKLEEVERAEANKLAIEKSMEELIAMLHPKDFEYIVDLIFQYSGWKKLTPGAGVEKDLDLDLLMPLTGERAFVQIKSSTDQAEYQKCESIFFKHAEYDRFFYVYHTSEQAIYFEPNTKPIHIMNVETVAKLVVELGLISILMKKVS
jgi:hypothetical protein